MSRPGTLVLPEARCPGGWGPHQVSPCICVGVWVRSQRPRWVFRHHMLESFCRQRPSHSVMMLRVVERQDLPAPQVPRRCLGKNVGRCGSNRGCGGWWRKRVGSGYSCAGTHTVPFEGEPSRGEGCVRGRDRAGVVCAGWDLPGAVLVQIRKHLVGTKTTEVHILGRGEVGLCWCLSGGTRCHTGANSGPGTPR